MTDKIKIEKTEDYILVTIPDKVITPKRAQEILNQIGEESIKFHCNKVLLDERTVERRDVPSTEIMQLSVGLTKSGSNKIYIAFLCDSKLIDRDAELLRLFTYKNEYLIQYFSASNAVIAWLKTLNEC